MFRKAAVLMLLTAAPAAAQVQSRPTDPPLVTAANESWYQLREPVQFAGDIYLPAGATVFFDRNTMVRTGHYNGVPLYADTTLEPFSIVYVPISRGLMQPYERRRQGDMAGTTASRTPSYPVRMGTVAGVLPQTAIAPSAVPLTIGAISAFSPEPSAIEPMTAPVAPRPAAAIAPVQPLVTATSAVGTTGRVMRRQDLVPIVSMRQPESNDGLWVQFAGERWVSAGAAVPLRAAEFRRVGEYAGFPVFIRSGEDNRIYLPTRAGLVAPYRLK